MLVYIHLDIAGSNSSHYCLCTFQYMRLKHFAVRSTTSCIAIHCLRSLFARLGVLDTVVRDSGEHLHYPMDWLMELCSYYCLKRCQTALKMEQSPFHNHRRVIKKSAYNQSINQHHGLFPMQEVAAIYNKTKRINVNY